MTAKRPGPFAMVLLALLALVGGTASVYFADAPRAPRLGGPHRIERNPLSVVAGEVPISPGAPAAATVDPAEVLHPADVLVRVLCTLDHMPAAGARVTLRDPLSTWSGVADERGEVPFAGVEAGVCSVLARAEGYAERRAFAMLREGANPEIVVHLGEAPAVEGRVVSALDGSPVAGATIHATPNPGPEVGEAEPPSAVSDAAGAFRLRAGTTGQALTLQVRAKGFVPGRKHLPLPSKEDAVATVEVVLDPTGILRGVVRDPLGRPRRGATVFAYPAGTEFRPMDRGARSGTVGPGRPVTAGAGPDGAYTLEGLALGGLYIVGASYPGYGRSEEKEILIAGGLPEVRADFDLRAQAGVFVKWPVGTRNNEGTGTVTLRDPLTRAVKAATSGIGTCRFTDVAPGRYEVAVKVLMDGKSGSALAEAKAGETAIVEITFAPPEPAADAAIEGQVTRVKGEPVEGARVLAIPVVPDLPVEGRPLPQSGLLRIPGRGNVRVSASARTGTDGRFRLDGLKGGAAYLISATSPGEITVGEEPVQAPASGVAVVLSPLGRLKGRLVLPPGAEVPRTINLRVAGADPADPFRSVASAGFNGGAFDTGDLVPGPCRVCGVAGECLLLPRDAVVRAGEVADLGDLPLLRGVMLAGRVVDSAGKPVPRVLVAFQGPVEFRIQSGEDGRFELGPVPEGEAALSLSVDGEVPLVRRVAAVPGGEIGDLLLPRQGTLLVRATQEGGRPWAGEVEIRGAGMGDRVYSIGRTDHLGRFSFSLPAREFQVVIRDPADRTRVLAEAPASVAEGAETKVELRVGR